MKILSFSSVNVINLPYYKNAAEYWFTPLSNYPWSILLHSGYSKHPCGRFDILVADPIGKLVTRGNNTIISIKERFTSNEDPLALLDQVLNKCFFNVKKDPNLPFQGGALGIFSYDLARRFEKIPNYAISDINVPDMAIGIYDWALIVDHFKKTVFLLSHSNVKSRLSWLKKQKKTIFKNFCLTSTWNSNMNFKEYAVKFSKIKTYLQNGECYQVNLSQRFKSYYLGDEWTVFSYLNKKNRAPFSAFLRIEEGVILSFSPERFIQLTNSKIQSRPIKGTIPRLYSQELDIKQRAKLKESIKDRAENLMIVDLLRNDIGRVAEPGTVRVPDLFVVETFSTVHHLVSTITAHLSSHFTTCDLLRATFPGGSITGAPKIRAMEIIDELEPQRRNVWCGSIGYISACGNMDTNIVIRSLIACKGSIYCSAGGGIVYDSQLKTEYQETFDKIRNVIDHLKNDVKIN